MWPSWKRGIREDLFSFQGGFSKMSRIYRKNLNSFQGDFLILLKVVCFRRNLKAYFRVSPWRSGRVHMYDDLHHEKAYFLIMQKNIGSDQLCDNSTADQHLYFGYIDSTISLLPKSEITSLFTIICAIQSDLWTDLVENPEDRLSQDSAQLYAWLFSWSARVFWLDWKKHSFKSIARNIIKFEKAWFLK